MLPASSIATSLHSNNIREYKTANVQLASVSRDIDLRFLVDKPSVRLRLKLLNCYKHSIEHCFITAFKYVHLKRLLHSSCEMIIKTDTQKEIYRNNFQSILHFNVRNNPPPARSLLSFQRLIRELCLSPCFLQEESGENQNPNEFREYHHIGCRSTVSQMQSNPDQAVNSV